MSGDLYLVARIGGRRLAFPADTVDSAIDLGAIVPVPRAAPGVVGLAALRSRVVTVIDPRNALGLADDAAGPPRAVVAQVDGHTYAIQVDALEDVAAFATLPLPPGLSLRDGWAGVGTAIIERDGEPVLVVRPETLVPAPAAVAA